MEGKKAVEMGILFCAVLELRAHLDQEGIATTAGLKTSSTSVKVSQISCCKLGSPSPAIFSIETIVLLSKNSEAVEGS